MLTQGATGWSTHAASFMGTPSLFVALARALLAGDQNFDGAFARAGAAMGRDWRWLRPLVRRYLKQFSGATRPRLRDVLQFLKQDEGFRYAQEKHALLVKTWLTASQRMQPAPAAVDWAVPAIESIGALQEWLGLDLGELEWFADLKGVASRQAEARLQHYNYKILQKRTGGIRLIEVPKARLKELQQRILRGILNKIPVHPAAHGFRKGRSIKTFAAPHAGRDVVLRMDVRDFFPSFSGARIQTFFRVAGYPEQVADLLGGICTNSVPHGVWQGYGFEADAGELREWKDLFGRPHLPQGAPTSPALASLCAYRLDCRLDGLAKSAHARYTRYADDLAFSGDEKFAKNVERFSAHVGAVLLEEGFSAHYRKTRMMRQGVRQYLVGLSINRKPNLARRDFDRLKAVLTNCVRYGPAGQNREGHPFFRMHLEGRVSFVQMVNPQKAARLRVLLEKIEWPEK